MYPFTRHNIPFSHLAKIVEEERIEFLPGDILFIRSGFEVAFNGLSGEEQRKLAERETAEFIGVEQSEDLLRWLWENQV